MTTIVPDRGAGDGPITEISDTAGAARLEPLHSRSKLEYLAWCALWCLHSRIYGSGGSIQLHKIGLGPFVLITLVLAWVTLPVYFLLIYFSARRQADSLCLPPGSRVAMVVTKAPSEPFSVVRRTLEAMLDQDLPHDTWLRRRSRSGDPGLVCGARGRCSTRRGRPDYHRAAWPRRTRCKEGNLAYFYDHFGYERCHFLIQLDADHIPTRTYLREMLKPFADPRVGYVSAPSICDLNAQAGRHEGRLYLEASLHGALQAGYNGGWAPTPVVPITPCRRRH